MVKINGTVNIARTEIINSYSATWDTRGTRRKKIWRYTVYWFNG